MIPLKKIFVWTFGCLVVLVIFLSIFILFSDKIINQPSIKNRIQSEISQAIGGRFELQRLGLAIFPQPNLMILRVGFSIPKTAQGTLASLTIYPKLGPLLFTKLQIAKIDLNAPDVAIQLSEKQKPKDQEQKSQSLDGLKKNAGAVFKVVSSKAPGLDLFVENGRLNVLKANKAVLEIKDIRSRIDFTENTVDLDLGCNIESWDRTFLNGNIRLAEDQSTLTLAQLKFGPSGPNLSGKMEINHIAKPPSPSFALELTGKDVDILAARKIALAQAGHIPVVLNIFNILKAGELPVITLNSRGNSLEELGKLENIHIKGRIQKGELSVPKVHLDLTHVNGDVTIEQGILQGEALEARLGNTFAGNATLKLGLAGENPLFQLNLPVTADLADLPAVLNRVIVDTAFAQELALVQNLKGSATGTIVLEEHLASLKTQVDVSEIHLSANY